MANLTVERVRETPSLTSEEIIESSMQDIAQHIKKEVSAALLLSHAAEETES